MSREPTLRLCLAAPLKARIAGPAILLDRDGVINRKIPGGYVTDLKHFEFIPGILPSLAALSTLGLPMVIVSNQACVGKGLLSRRALARITHRFVGLVREAGGRIDAVYYCPHTPDAQCGCRKPRTGMIERAARDFAINLRDSVLVGDSPTDVEAARRTGCQPIMLVERRDADGPCLKGCVTIDSAEKLFPAVVRVLNRPGRRSRPRG